MVDFKALERELVRDEKREPLMYLDSRGIPTIGVGHNIRDNPLPDQVIDLLFRCDVNEVIENLDRAVPWWEKLDPVRGRVLINMCFNLGLPRLLGFHHFLAALQDGDFNRAADEMENSDWHKQVGHRAVRLEEVMRTGYMP